MPRGLYDNAAERDRFRSNNLLADTGTAPLSGWTLTFAFANGQKVTQLWNGTETQSGATVTVTNMSYNGSVAAGATFTGIGFNGSWNCVTNAAPTSFSVNGTLCK
ncbi:MAG: cellulose binding domain-containing protein [Terracidiphilus sp.]